MDDEGAHSPSGTSVALFSLPQKSIQGALIAVDYQLALGIDSEPGG